MSGFRHGGTDQLRWFLAELRRSGRGRSSLVEMDYLEHGRECYAHRSWGEAYRALTSADELAPLEVDDLDRLATAAYLTSREEEFLGLHERLFRAHVGAGNTARAARCTFWLAITYLLRGETGRSNAWLARGQRLVEDGPTVEGGYLEVVVATQQLREGHAQAAQTTASRACAIGHPRGTPIWRPPGLALLRLAQGRTRAACATIRRLTTATTDPMRRAELLPAHLDIMLAIGDLKAARRARDELHERAGMLDADALRAVVSEADGAIAIADGNPHAALDALRRAFEIWTRFDAPYEAARVRVLIGEACRGLGDHESAALEFDAAKAAFARLGAQPDLDRLNAPEPRPSGSPLTARELHVLRLISTGRTNKQIAAELSVSERTIDRHVANILTKLDVPSRAAATAYAYDRQLF